MKTLWEISADMQALDELLFELAGELSNEEIEAAIDAWLQENEQNLAEKLDGYCSVIAEREVLNDLRVREARRLIALANVDSNKTVRMRLRLKAFFESRGIRKYETALHKFSVAANGGAQPITIKPEWEAEPASAPEAYHKKTIELDKDAIRADLLAGQLIEGCALAPRGTHLRIK
ncbi:MAG: siphovirus Gp157 family protein [Blastocatellia bacterium]